MKAYTLIPLFYLLSFPILAKEKQSADATWLFSIDGNKKTTQDLRNAYSGFLVLLKEQLQQRLGQLIRDAEFKSWLDNPGTAPAALRGTLEGFSEAAFSTQYQDMELVIAEAAQSGFANQPEIKAKLQALEKYYLANLYIFAQLEKEMLSPTEQEIAAHVAQLKGIDSVKGLSDAELRQHAVSQLTLLKAQEKQRNLMIKLRAKHDIKENENLETKKSLRK
ncbi:MAG: hypothetical protein J0L53_05550 [Spirochaetes bacterium]|nr:hypothetical protein [Spirochaetota bacterium]